MITTELMFQKSSEEGYTFAEEDVITEMEKIRANYPTEELFMTAMKNQGLTEEMFRNQLERNLTIKKFVEEEISSKQTVTEEEMREYYEETPNLWEREEEVGAKHILVKTTKDDPPDTLESKRARIEALLIRIRNGESLETLAAEHSECPSASKGGDLGYFSRGRMVKPFEDAAFSMSVGDVSDVIESTFGFHIIEVYGKREAGTLSYEDAVEIIEPDFLQRHTNAAIRALIDELKANREIERLL
jgi:peptidyl-prolyl cis-trans isomerase C